MIKINFRPDDRMLRQFAWISLFAFPLLALLLHWRFGLPWSWVYVLSGLGAAVFLAGVVLGDRAFPRIVFVGVSVVTVPIGMVLSWVMVWLIYYGLFTGIAAMFRLVGRDAMRRKMDPAQQSYWLDRGPPRRPASYFKLY